ncbi:DNA polymerase III subunit delta' [uncultured Rhodospira sp.]|uniref:DNA polymerase III subunit delta' n=1 Tax=uncultured Rhodospira sp. TaxID=1936189 RepID=UPI002616CA20|nr:DNA polymerase III subunit delta' [uncultured Rhodospira sp.]
MAKGGTTSSDSSTEGSDAAVPPRANALLAGQAEAEAEVLRAWEGGRLSHAWLLTGPRGIGKATLAFRMARFILAGGAVEPAQTAPDPGPSLFGDPPAPPAGPSAPSGGLAMTPEHPVFRRVRAGSHADLRVIERGSSDEKQAQRDLDAGREPRRRDEIVVGDVRDLGAFLSLTPAEGGWRVVVIDAADEMNRNAANAVLKVLEEPPPRSVLVLLAHTPARLPATIPSRCRRLALRPLPPPVMRELLATYRPDLEESARATLIGLAQGSIGRALDLARKGGLDLYGDVMALVAQAPRMDVAKCHALGDRVAKDDAAWHLFRDLVPGWLARLGRVGALGDRPAGGVDEGEHAVMQRLSRAGALDRWVTVWEKTNHLLGRTDAVNLDRKQAALAVLLLIDRAAARS